MSAFDDLIVSAAEKFRIDANLIRAIARVESNLDNWSVRYEPTLKLANDVTGYAQKNLITYATEEVLQHMSFGLMQILGVVARDLGFTDKLVMLCIPEIGLFYGCKQLQRLQQRYGEDEASVISAYNAGTAKKTDGGMYINQSYIDKVYGELLKLRKLN